MSPPSTDSSDEVFLDNALEEMLTNLSDGRQVDLGEWARARPDLLPRLEQLAELARATTERVPLGPPKVPGFEFVRQLGRGSSGAVWLARQLRVGGRLVALKIVPTLTCGAAQHRRRAEARALARLDHPNILKILDVVEVAHAIVFVTDWIQGPSLSEWVRSRPVEPRGEMGQGTGGSEWSGPMADRRQFVADLGIQLGRALDEVHRLGMLHRDVKPSNILLRPDGTPVLCDFGLVRDQDRAGSRTQTGLFLGTTDYAPPEQLRGEHDQLDASSDVYSLAASLYFALHGAHPHRGSTPTQVLAHLTEDSDRRTAQDGSPLGRALLIALSPIKEDRYPTAGRFAEDLMRVRAGQDILARAPGPLRRLVRRFDGRLLRAGFLLLLGMLLFAVGTAITKWRGVQTWHARELLLESSVVSHAMEARGFTDIALPYFSSADFEDRLELSRDHYSRALFLWGSEELTLEKQAVETALLEVRGESHVVGGAFSGYWKTRGRDPTPLDVESLSASELRAVGLLAYLLGDLEQCGRVWSRLEREFGSLDPFLQAALGLVLLAEGNPSSAYGRLFSVARDFTQAPFLNSFRADLAFEHGEVELARETLGDPYAEVRGTPYSFDRVIRGDLAAWALDWRTAEALYAGWESHRSPRNLVHWAVALEHQGRLEEGLLRRAQATVLRRIGPTYLRDFDRAFRTWWASLTPEGRYRRLVQALTESPEAEGSLRSYLRILERARRPSGPPSWEVPTALENRWKRMNVRARLASPIDGEPVLDQLHVTLEILSMQPSLRMYLPPSIRKALLDAAIYFDGLLSAPFGRLGGSWDRLWRTLCPGLGRLLGRVGLVLAAGATGTTFSTAQSLVRVHVGMPGSNLGHAVAGIGDVDRDGHDDYAIGAPEYASGQPGSLELFSGRTGASLRRFEGRLPGDALGASVTNLGDLDGDSYDELAIGAPGTLSLTGYVLVVSTRPAPMLARRNTGRGLLYRLEGSAPGDRFGDSVAGIGDVDADGIRDILVSATEGSNGSGYVRLFSGADGGLIYQVTGSGGRFGISIAPLRDLDGDATEDFVVGAYQWGPGTTGAAFVHSGANGNSLGSLAPGPSIALGRAVLDVGDLDGDGLSEIAVTARAYSTLIPRLRIYRGSDFSLFREDVGGPGGQWSHLDGGVDYDCDGTEDFLMGAQEITVPGGAPGFVRAYSGLTGTVIFSVQGAVNGEQFSYGLSIIGDVNADGAQDFAIGSNISDAGGTDSGLLQVFLGPTCPGPLLSGSVTRRDVLPSDGDLLEASEVPTPGQSWPLRVTSIKESGLTVLVMSRFASWGERLQRGRFLVDLESVHLVRSQRLEAHQSSFNLPVPGDTALIGQTLHLQAFTGKTRADLGATNALQVLVGPTSKTVPGRESRD